jgi:hypothetical protein
MDPKRDQFSLEEINDALLVLLKLFWPPFSLSNIYAPKEIKGWKLMTTRKSYLATISFHRNQHNIVVVSILIQ